MRKYLLITIFILLTVLIQDSFSLEFLGPALNPNLVLALSFAFLLVEDRQSALYSAFIGGLWIDLLGVGIVGLSSFIFVLMIIIASWVRRRLISGLWVQMVLITVFTGIYKLIVNYPNFNYSWSLVLSGLLTLLIMNLVHIVLSRYKTRYLSFEFRIKA